MAKGDVAVTLTLPPDTEKTLAKLASKRGCSRREIVIQGIKSLTVPPDNLEAAAVIAETFFKWDNEHFLAGQMIAEAIRNSGKRAKEAK